MKGATETAAQLLAIISRQARTADSLSLGSSLHGCDESASAMSDDAVSEDDDDADCEEGYDSGDDIDEFTGREADDSGSNDVDTELDEGTGHTAPEARTAAALPDITLEEALKHTPHVRRMVTVKTASEEYTLFLTDRTHLTKCIRNLLSQSRATGRRKIVLAVESEDGTVEWLNCSWDHVIDLWEYTAKYCTETRPHKVPFSGVYLDSRSKMDESTVQAVCSPRFVNLMETVWAMQENCARVVRLAVRVLPRNLHK